MMEIDDMHVQPGLVSSNLLQDQVHELMETDDEIQDQVHELMETDDDTHVQPEPSSNYCLLGTFSAVFGSRLGSMLIVTMHWYLDIFSNAPVSMVMFPANTPVHYENSAQMFVIYMREILHGQYQIPNVHRDIIVTKISNDDDVSRDPNVKFWAAFLNVEFKWNSDSLRGIDAMAECFRHTINPTLSLVLYHTMKGRKALDEGKIDEAKGILESADVTAARLEPSLESLFFLRVFSILKERLHQRSGDPRYGEEYRLVLARAGDMANRFPFGEANKGLLSRIHWERARAYLGYHPDFALLFPVDVNSEEIEVAHHAISQVEDGLESLGLDPNQFGAHCLVKAVFVFRKRKEAEALAWASKVREAAYASPRTIERARRFQTSLEQEVPSAPMRGQGPAWESFQVSQVVAADE